MARRILILSLLSLAFVFVVQEKEPGIQAGRSGVVVSAAPSIDGNGGFPSGECTCADPEDGGRHEGEIPPAFLARETAVGRAGPDTFERRGPGPILSSLSDSLNLSRPPPAAPGRLWRDTGMFRREPGSPC